PVWLWSGSLMGLLIVLTVTFSGARIGVAATVAILIAGQLAAGVLIDRFGFFGVDRVAIHWPRMIGIALLPVGAALTLRRCAVASNGAGASTSTATSASVMLLASPTNRSGPTREPTRSDQRPPPIRKAAASTCMPAKTSAACPCEKPRSS